VSGRAQAFIPEIFCDPRDRHLLATLVIGSVERLVDEDIDSVITLAVRDTLLDRCLRRAGFRFRSGSFDTCITLLQMRDLPQPLLDPHPWFLAGGDFDVI
jgi:hypothetical protein